MPPAVFRPDWETLARLAFTSSKPLDLDACPASTSLRRFCGATNRSLLGFEAQTKKPSWWFEAQITKPELLVLRPKPRNPPHPWFWGSTNKLTADFEAKPGETIVTSFKAKLEKTIATGFETKPVKTIASVFGAKPLETVATSFEAKPAKTVRVVLRPNHS
jgi:hypothetical protein